MLRNLLWNQFSFPEKIVFPRKHTQRFPVKSWKIYGHIFSKGFVRCYLKDIKWTKQQNFSDLFTIIGRRFFLHLSRSWMIYWHIASKEKSRKSNILTNRWKKLLNVSARSQNVIEIRFGSQEVFFVKNRLIFNFLCLGIFLNANRLVPKHMFRFQCLFGLSSSLAKANNEKVSQIMKTQWFLDDRWIVIQFV